MKKIIITILCVVLGSTITLAQESTDLNTIEKLSKDKWQWMAEKNVEELDKLFDEKSMFVHMGGSWGKQQELDVIKTGNIWYKKLRFIQ